MARARGAIMSEGEGLEAFGSCNGPALHTKRCQGPR
jgi:hypothetical protein